jgi:hypothetical protein
VRRDDLLGQTRAELEAWIKRRLSGRQVTVEVIASIRLRLQDYWNSGDLYWGDFVRLISLIAY